MDEDRFIVVGSSNEGRLLLVCHIERAGRIRILSARALTRAERKAYEEIREQDK